MAWTRVEICGPQYAAAYRSAMQTYSELVELARICLKQASLTTNPVARGEFIRLAKEYQLKAITVSFPILATNRQPCGASPALSRGRAASAAAGSGASQSRSWSAALP